MVLFARIWGLAKYHHPDVVACQVDWDQALFDALPRFESASTGTMLADAVQALLAAAGPVSARPPGEATPAWIRQAPLPATLIHNLAWLAAQQPTQQCYVGLDAVGVADFQADRGHIDPWLPDRPRRVLALFRFWNGIEYFFPYKDVIGQDWAQVLATHLPPALAADNRNDWLLAIRQFTADISESHAHMMPSPVPVSSLGTAPFRVGLIEGRLVVTRVLPEAVGVSPGDELLKVDDVPVRHRHRAWLATSYGSNPIWRETYAAATITAGRDNPGRFQLRRADGSRHVVTLPRSHSYRDMLDTNPRPPVQTVPLPGCRIGVLNLSQLDTAMVPWAMQQVADTDALVVDIRGYPADAAVFQLAGWFYDRPTQATWLTVPDLTRPGRFSGFPVLFQGRPGQRYPGRLLVLHNEDSISASEYAVMILQGSGRALTFGSQTAAADGNITYMHLPGGILAFFSGMGVFYPDGRATQPIGLVPDVHVHPSRTGLAARRDQVLEAALDCRWLEQTPARRLPQPGLYRAERRAASLDAQVQAGQVWLHLRDFDHHGEPLWLRSQGPVDAADDGRGSWADRFVLLDSEGAAQARDGHALDFHSGPYQAVCADVDQYNLHPRARWLAPDGHDGSQERCALPELLADDTAITGLWQELASGDRGWQLSLHRRGNQVQMQIYGFDGQGQPRWLTGSAHWNGQGSLSAPLWRHRGCQNCARPWQERLPAGRVSVQPRLVAEDGRVSRLLVEIQATFAADDVLRRDGVLMDRLRP
ncbi:MAG: S41 family peptidase [Lysobacterales bacterium]